jgi:hypothetical protein
MRRLGESGCDFSFEPATIRSGSAGLVAGSATEQKRSCGGNVGSWVMTATDPSKHVRGVVSVL